MSRLEYLRDLLLERDGKAGYKLNCAHIRAEIARLEGLTDGQADRSGSQVDPA